MHISKKNITFAPKVEKTYTATMKTIQLDGEILQEDFFARVEEAEQDIEEGKGIVFTNKADMNAWLNSL